MLRSEFFKGKKVLVTGHTGFKGTWLSLMLELLGAEIYGYALAGSEGQGLYKKIAPRVVKNYGGYIQNQIQVKECVHEVSPEIIIHLASHSILNESDQITDYIFDTNVMGVVNLLEAVREVSSVQAVLIVTSDKCYENKEDDSLYTETARLGAQDPYSTSKACQELVTECYRKSFFSKEKGNIPIATARASNVVGGGDENLTRLFPYLLECFACGKEAQIRKPQAIRPWQNILDVLGGYLQLVQELYLTRNADSIYSSAFNFGPEEDGFVTVEKVAMLLAEEYPQSSYKVIEPLQNVIETNILKLDSYKAKKILGWEPVYHFQDTIKMAVEYKKRCHGDEAERDIAVEMILHYMEKDRKNDK